MSHYILQRLRTQLKPFVTISSRTKVYKGHPRKPMKNYHPMEPGFYNPSGAYLQQVGKNPFWDEGNMHTEAAKYAFPKGPHAETPRYPGEYDVERPYGKIYDNKPFKITLEAGKKYAWCSCGLSKRQPFCDGQHKIAEGTTMQKTMPKFRPIRFSVDEDKEVWLCNCKQSKNKPYCDGTHRNPDIVGAVLT